MKKYFNLFVGALLTVLAFVSGAGANVVFAMAEPLDDGGKIESGNPGESVSVDTVSGKGTQAEGGPAEVADGIATETAGRAAADPEFYTKEIDKRITKIRPMATPVDTISRYAKAIKSSSFEVKYYSVGTRPVKTTVATGGVEVADAESFELKVDDPSMFTVDDTIRVVGVKATHKANNAAYDASVDKIIPDLVLCVCGKATSSQNPICFCVNGDLKNSQAVKLPQNLAAGTVLVRMGKAAGELDVQTGRFATIPTPEVQYCQNFMIQVEQSTFDKIASKEVNWNFSDLEEDGIADMKLAMEYTYLFGDKHMIKHISKNGMAQWFTGGIWYMAGKDIEVGEYDALKGTTVISDDNLVDISKDLFVGTGVGNKQKVLICGSDMLAAFSKIQSEKFRLKETVEAWNLKFKSWETDFGEILTIHSELFDLAGMADCGFALDPEFLTKAVHVSWSRNILDLKKAGIRNTDAVVIQEVACLYLRYAKAHARLKLAGNDESSES